MITPGYSPDLNAFSLAKLKHQLQTTRLLPSQQILREQIEERFACLEQNGIANLAQLQKALNTKADVQAFANQTGLPLDYLTILRREVNSNLPKPIDLKEFPGVDTEVVRQLQQSGIKTTEQLFPHVLTLAARRAFAQQHQLTDETVLDLARLTDVARTKWVGPKFARLLVEAGYGSVAKIANADGDELYQALLHANEVQRLYQGKFGIEDMNMWIKTVQDVPQVIQY